MQRNETRLRPEADQRRDRDERLGAAAGSCERGGVADRAVVLEDEHRDPDTGAAEMRDREVRVHGRTDRRVAFGDQDRGGRDERHQLPEGKERNYISREQNAREREQECGHQRTERPLAARPREIVARVDECRHRGEGEHREEQAAQPVDADRGGERARER